MKKINTKMIIMQCIFLVIVIGGSILLYSIFGPAYYQKYRIKIANEAFNELKDVDIGDLDEHMDIISDYESYNFNFVIADEKMTPIYSTIGEGEESVYKNIKIRIDDFKTTPLIIKRKSHRSENVRLLGIIKQGEQQYYICIKDRIKSVNGSFEFTVILLDILFLIALAVGSAVMHFMSNGLSVPIKKLELVAKDIAQRDFSQKADENGKFEELNNLASSINSMSEQLQKYIVNIEKSKKILVQQNIQQERLEKARKDFVSNVSHELKTPLAIISSQVEMLEYLKDKEQRDYYYTSIQEEITKMSEMVGNLLNITVMEHNMGQISKKSFDLNETVTYIILKYDALFQRKGVKVFTEIEEDFIVYGDRDYIEQAVGNFIMNALQHTEDGDIVKISLSNKNNNTYFRVYNQGNAIERSEMENIWKSFYFNDESKEEDIALEHTGLGLYIVKCVIEMHGGSCGVNNLEDGVEFWFSLPSVQPVPSA